MMRNSDANKYVIIGVEKEGLNYTYHVKKQGFQECIKCCTKYKNLEKAEAMAEKLMEEKEEHMATIYVGIYFPGMK